MYRSVKLALVAAGFSVMASGAAAADRLSTLERVTSSIYDSLESLWPDDATVPGLKAQLGVGMGFSPDYKGSDNYDLSLVPLIRLQYRDMLTLSGYTLRYNAFNDGALTVGGLMRYESGRSQKSNPALEGRGNISDTVSVGPFIQYRIGPARLFADMRHSLGAGQGTRVDFGVRMGIHQEGRWSAMTALTGTWVSSKHARTFYAVTAQQSAASPYDFPVYRLNSGITDVGLAFGSRYRITEHTSVVNFVEYARLLGDFKGSPLTQVGSANQVSGGVGVLFDF